MAHEELLKQDEKEQGKPKVVAIDGKWTPQTEIRWNKHASTINDYLASLQWPSIHGFTTAYFAHRELEIPPSKRKSYKNL